MRIIEPIIEVIASERFDRNFDQSRLPNETRVAARRWLNEKPGRRIIFNHFALRS